MRLTYTFMDERCGTAGADRMLGPRVRCAMLASCGTPLGAEGRGRAPTELGRELLTGLIAEHGHNVVTWGLALAGEWNQSRRSMPLVTQVGADTLDPYQIDTIRRLSAAGGVMSLGCGLGKTITALCAAADYALRWNAVEPVRCWIVCPLNAIPAWAPHVAWLKAHGFAEVEVVSMDSLHRMVGLAPAPGVVIFDEVHLLGVANARRTMAAHQVRAAFTVGLCLTGTLLHAGIEKVLSVLDLAVPGAAGFATKWAAGRAFGCLAKKQLGQRTLQTLARPSTGKREAFYTYLDRFVISLTKHSALVRSAVDIPDQIVTTVTFPTTESVTDAVVRIAAEIRERDGRMPHAQEVMHCLSRDGLPQKLGWLTEHLDVRPADADDPIVVFAVYRHSLDQIEQVLRARGLDVVRIDGDVTGPERIRALDRFQSGAPVFLGQIDAASVSMNLQRARRSVLVDATWRAANYDQGLARTCRRGSTQECEHWNLAANKFQANVFKRLDEAKDFDASVAEWQEISAIVKGSRYEA